jgi:hypothetical protein
MKLFLYLFRLFLLISFLFLTSCEKDIQIRLDPTSSQLVVEATIENNRPPIVFLSTSFDFFSKIDSAKLAASLVRNARVTVSDGTQTVVLVEDSLVTVEGTKLFFYTPSRAALPFVGKTNTRYTLNIQVDGVNYSASTTIPEITRRIDSLWWEPLPFSKDSNDVRVVLRATDRPGLGDYIRYFTQVGKGPYLPGFNSVFDDQVIDGITYTIPIDKGFDKNGQFSDSTSTFKRGDTLTLKLCNIDKQTYDFWRTYEFSFQSIGNPFSTPTRILSNISGGALGYFGGYGAQYRSLIIPKR